MHCINSLKNQIISTQAVVHKKAMAIIKILLHAYLEMLILYIGQQLGKWESYPTGCHIWVPNFLLFLIQLLLKFIQHGSSIALMQNIHLHYQPIGPFMQHRSSIAWTQKTICTISQLALGSRFKHTPSHTVA